MSPKIAGILIALAWNLSVAGFAEAPGGHLKGSDEGLVASRTMSNKEQSPAPFLPLIFAQVTPPSQEGPSADHEIKEAPTSPAAEAPSPDSEGNESKKPKRSGEFLVAPIPILSPTIGSGVVLVGGYLFPLNKNDKVSPPSMVGGVGFTTNNDSRGLAFGGRLYFKENRYRATLFGGKGTVHYNLYGVGPGAGNDGKSVPIVNRGQFFFGEFLRRVGWDIFVGPRYQFVQATTGVTAETSRPDINELLKDAIKARASALGLRVLRETRDSTFYPTRGHQIDIVSDFFAQSLGSTFSYQSYTFSFNHFSSLARNQVLAYRFAACGVNGDAPFYAMCLFGTKNDLRGYEAGRYIDRRMFATQLEYRRVLPMRLGLVGFGGVGEVAPSLGKFNYDNLLPSVGAGLRFTLSKKNHINYRIDYAVGKTGHTWSMGVGEAF